MAADTEAAELLLSTGSDQKISTGLKRLKCEWQAQERNALLNDLAAKLGGMELHDVTDYRFDAGYMAAHAEVWRWMNEQAPTEGEA